MGKDKNSVFSFDTIKDFDGHIDVSIPGYSNLIEHVVNLSTYFVKEGGRAYDLGASTGKLHMLMSDHNSITCDYIGIDTCENLASESVNVIEENLVGFEPEPFDFATSIFTLQFIPVKDRLDILREFYEALKPGGAMIVAEKVFMEDGFVQDVMNFTYYDFKLKSFKAEEIINKQLDLRYIMRPITAQDNEDMFHQAGFSNIQPFWQNLQFRAWLLLK